MIIHNSFLNRYIENNHPAFLIIPFRKYDIYNNTQINNKYNFNIKKILEQRYPGKHVTITENARKALSLAINSIRDIEKPNFFIQTTSDNYYISSCVTNTIETEDCSWHRNAKEKYNSFLLNHEFGYVDNRKIEKINEIQWIEDCAFAFNSNYRDGEKAGTKAPYSIFSLSKFFPMQIGGFLLSNKPILYDLDTQYLKYISNVTGYYFQDIDKWSDKRQLIYHYFVEVFKELGCDEYFNYSINDIPGVFLFNLPKIIDTQSLKKYYWQRGIQCSVFYGEQAFYLPLNQYTEKWHVDYFAELLFNFITNIYE